MQSSAQVFFLPKYALEEENISEIFELKDLLFNAKLLHKILGMFFNAFHTG